MLANKNSLRHNQSGMASFFITLIMMIVITLIVLGFAQVSNRNQRESLDRQESTQAYYAAESGINDVAYDIKQANGNVSSQSSCQGTNYYDPGKASLGNGVGYTCVLVDATPQVLDYNTVNNQTSTVAPLTATNNLSSLTFTWDAQSGASGSCGANQSQYRYYLPQRNAWDCGFGLIRVDLVKNPDTISDVNGVSNAPTLTDTLYLTPYGSRTGKIVYPSPPSPQQLLFGSSTAYYGIACNFLTATDPGCTKASGSGSIKGTYICETLCGVTVALPGDTSQYYARITSLYQNPQNVYVSGKDVNGQQANFAASQVVVDVTGKSQDVLRRVQVRLGVTPGSGAVTAPNDALISSQSICKDFTINPGDTITPASVCN